jgi:hypothetical protein
LRRPFCAGVEASPSPVYGARLLSGLRLITSRGFKSRRLRQVTLTCVPQPNRAYHLILAIIVGLVAAGVAELAGASDEPLPGMASVAGVVWLAAAVAVVDSAGGRRTGRPHP